MSDRETMKGWKTAQVRRYDVPAQKVSVAFPERPRAIALISQYESCCRIGLVTHRQDGNEDIRIKSNNHGDDTQA